MNNKLNDHNRCKRARNFCFILFALSLSLYFSLFTFFIVRLSSVPNDEDKNSSKLVKLTVELCVMCVCVLIVDALAFVSNSCTYTFWKVQIVMNEITFQSRNVHLHAFYAEFYKYSLISARRELTCCFLLIRIQIKMPS